MKKLVIGLMVAGVFLFVTDAFAVVGIDANTVLMLHFNGTDGSTNFVDSSFSNHSIIANGNAQIDTAQSKFGSASGLFDGTGDYLSLADNDDWNFGSGDFTIDSWVRFNSLTDIAIACQKQDDNNFWGFEYTPGDRWLLFRITSGGHYTLFSACTWTPNTDTWYHLAVNRLGSGDTPDDWRIFIDGQAHTLTKYAGNWDAAIPDLSTNLSIGSFSTYQYFLNGWIDELRISKGIARWTSDFTPPTSEYEVASEKVIPEPATLSLLGLGLLGLVFRRKKTS